VKRLLCEAISGSEADIHVLTEAEVEQRGLPKRKGVLGYASGKFSVCDKQNKNKRMYERSLWEGVHGSDRFKSMLEGMLLLGEPDHPETRTQSSIREGSHTVVEQHLDPDNMVRGTVAVFNNPLGQIVWPMLEAGVKLGFSTRGDGDLIEDAKSGGSRVDPSSYEYHGVDFVLNPSFVEAVPDSITEQQVKRVRTALTEAATKIEDETRQNVHRLLEAAEKRETDSHAPLEAALTQLTEAKMRNADLEKELEIARGQVKESIQKSSGVVAEATARVEKAEKAISDLSSRNEQLLAETKKLKESSGRKSKKEKDAEASRVSEIKLVMAENQRSHLDLVARHRKLLSEHRELDAAYSKGLQVIEGLRTSLKESEKRAQKAEGQIKESEGRLSEARSRLEEQASSLPEIQKQAVFEAYKSRRLKDVDVPRKLQPLLEKAETEDEIDEVLELIESSGSRMYGLPTRHCRGIRELLNEGSVETHSGDGGNPPRDSDARDVYTAVKSGLRR
jgi:hypothetical protein